jgi:hypothetical protein
MAGSDARTFIDLAMLSNTSRGCSLMRASRPVTATSPSLLRCFEDLNYARFQRSRYFSSRSATPKITSTTTRIRKISANIRAAL